MVIKGSCLKNQRKQVDRALKKIIFVPTDEKLTFAGGLPALIELFEASGLEKELLNCLPERKHARSIGSTKLAYTIMFSFLYGFECLEDINKFRKDPALREIFNDEAAAARTIGDFLRDFKPEHIERLNKFLDKMCRYIWKDLNSKLPPEFKQKLFVLDVDSVMHEQTGELMEGLAFNFKSQWGLDSQQSYDQWGFCHGYQLRPGNTKSGVNAVELIENTFRDDLTQVERRAKGRDLFRADSAYCNQEIIKKLLDKGVRFTITAHDGVTRWKTLMKNQGIHWLPWVYSEKDKLKAKKKGKELPRVELGRVLWTPGWSKKDGSKLVFPILVKRTWSSSLEKKRQKAEREKGLFMNGFLQEEPWEYYAVLTDVPLHRDKPLDPMSPHQSRYWNFQEVFQWHQKRGNAENFIREEKYNFKLKNYPCQKLMANHAYGQIAQIAHNLLRWVAILLQPDKPHYSKKLRNNLLLIPGNIIKHAGYTIMKVPRWAYKEVQTMREACGFKPERVPAYYSTA